MSGKIHERFEELSAIIRRVPLGRVASYGMVGRAMERPVSGLIVGRWMSQMDSAQPCPWWRIVAATGSLVIAGRSPELALIQRSTLEAEGVEFDDDLVEWSFFVEHLEVDGECYTQDA